MHFMEVAKLDFSSNYRNFWLLTVNEAPESNKAGLVKSTKTLYQVNCKKSLIGALQSYDYDADGSVLDSYRDKDVHWFTPPPDTVAEKWISLACSKKSVLEKRKSIEDPDDVAQWYFSRRAAESETVE